MSIYHKYFKTDAEIPYQKIAADVAEWDAIDDIVDFVMACITDDEVLIAVIDALKERNDKATITREALED